MAHHNDFDAADAADPGSPLTTWVQAQPWYRKYAKGIAAAAGLAVNTAMVVTMVPTGTFSPETALVVGLIVQSVLGVAGVVATPNALTEWQLQQLRTYVDGFRH